MTSAASSMIAVRPLRRASALAFLAVMLVPSAALADAKADALFKEGRTLLDAKKYDEACPKLAESQKLEPGAGTLLALALCHEGQGKTATAYAELKEAAELGRAKGRDALAAAAEKKAAAMAGALSKVVVHVRAPEATVTLDGKPLEKDAFDKPINVDPGEHKVEATANDKVAKSYVVRLTGAGITEITVDALEPMAKEPGKPVVPPPLTEPPHEEESAPGRGNTQRAIGVITIGLGVAAVGVGGYMGIRAMNHKSQADRLCPSTPCANDEEAQMYNDRSKAAMNWGLTSAAAGLGAIVAGTFIYVLAPRSATRVVPEASPTSAGLTVVSTF
jgi:hypothetical protein